MSKLEIILKPKELKKAFGEQKSTGRVVLSFPLTDDADENAALGELYDVGVKAHIHRGELGFADVLTKRKVNGVIETVMYSARVIAMVFDHDEKKYLISIRFADKDLPG